MPATHISRTGGRIVPWANGLGLSREIIREQTELQNESPQLLWRLAATRIEADCPFSPCAGQDRIIVLLKGNGFELTHGSEKPQVVMSPFGAIHFGGDWRTSCWLVDGPVEVLNVMSDRNRIACSISRIGIGEEPLARTFTSTTLAMYVLDGELIAHVEGEPELVLQAGETLRLESEAPQVAQLQARGGTANLLLVEARHKLFQA